MLGVVSNSDDESTSASPGTGNVSVDNQIVDAVWDSMKGELCPAFQTAKASLPSMSEGEVYDMGVGMADMGEMTPAQLARLRDSRRRTADEFDCADRRKPARIDSFRNWFLGTLLVAPIVLRLRETANTCQELEHQDELFCDVLGELVHVPGGPPLGVVDVQPAGQVEPRFVQVAAAALVGPERHHL